MESTDRPKNLVWLDIDFKHKTEWVWVGGAEETFSSVHVQLQHPCEI